MPDLTISVTTEQAQRIRKALGKWVTPEPTEEEPNPAPVWTLAAVEEVKDAIKRLLKRQVYVYEKNEAERAATAAVATELEDEGWSE